MVTYVAGSEKELVSVKRSSSRSPTCAQPKRTSRSKVIERASPRAQYQQTSHDPPMPMSRITQTRDGCVICMNNAISPMTGNIFALSRMVDFMKAIICLNPHSQPRRHWDTEFLKSSLCLRDPV